MNYLRALAVVTALAATTACSPQSSMTTPTSDAEAIAYNLDLAREAGAGQEQIDALVLAVQSGEMTLENVRALYEMSMECLTDNGFTVVDGGLEELTPGSALKVPVGTVYPPGGMSDTAAEALMDQCDERFVAYAMSAYVDQPSNRDAVFVAWERPEVRQCLTDKGYVVPDDASGHEVNLIARDDLNAHGTEPGFAMCAP